MQNLGAVVLTAIAVNAFAGLPYVAARESPNLEKEICKVICEPLPGGEKDAPEEAYNEVCTLSGVVTRITKLADQAAPIIGALTDCQVYCSSVAGAIPKALYDAGTAGVKYYAGDVAGATIDFTKTVTKTACSFANLAPGIGYYACQSCCNGLKLLGKA